MNNDLNIQYLERIYDDLQREQMRIMTELKNNNQDKSQDKYHQKLFSTLNTLLINVMRLRNLKKGMEEKKNI